MLHLEHYLLMNLIENKNKIVHVNKIVCLFEKYLFIFKRRRKKKQQQPIVSDSPIINLIHQRQKSSEHNSIRLSNCDASISLSNNLSNRKCSSKKLNEKILLRTNTNSGGGDSGYSEDSFVTTTISSLKRPLHTSCPHCHCEQRSSFKNYKKSIENYSTDSSSSSSDTTINTSQVYYKYFKQKQSLSASRSYPHIKPLPKTIIQPKKIKTIPTKRRRHLSCDSSLWTKIQTQQPINLVIFYINKDKTFIFLYTIDQF